MLRRLREVGAENIDITTNGYFLEEKLSILLKHGVNPITVTLNTLDSKRYAKIAGTSKNSLKKVLAGIAKIDKAGLKVNINLTALDNIPLQDIIKVVDFSKKRKFVFRICEPTYVIGADATRKKVRFKEALDYLERIAQGKVNSACESVDYLSTKGGGKITVMRNLCDNRYCDSCAKYLYLRLTSEGKLKPCLSRTDTEVQISENPKPKDLGLAFAKAIAHMGKGLKDNDQKGLVLKTSHFSH